MISGHFRKCEVFASGSAILWGAMALGEAPEELKICANLALTGNTC